MEVGAELHRLKELAVKNRIRETSNFMQANKRSLAAALAAVLAAPITIVAALSGNISKHIGISQGALLIADGMAILIVFLLLAMKLRRNRIS